MKYASKAILLLPIILFAIIIPYGLVSANDELFSPNTIQETTTEPEETKPEETEKKEEETTKSEITKSEITKSKITKSEITKSETTKPETPSPIPFFKSAGQIIMTFSLLVIALYIARKRPNAP